MAWLMLSLPKAQAQSAKWVNPVSGTWIEAAKWSSSPTYPNGAGFDASIAAPSGSYTVSLASNVTLNSLTLNSASATLSQTAGTLGVGLGGVTLQNGTYLLSGGTLSTSTIQLSGGAALILNGGTIRNATISTSVPSAAQLGAGTLDPSHLQA